MNLRHTVRVVFEHDENEQPGLLHAVRQATTKEYEGVLYFTECGEILISDAKRPSRRRGIPTCIRCYAPVKAQRVEWP